MYDMYPTWDEPAGTAARNGSSRGAKPGTRVEHIRRRAARPGTSPALKAVQASLDRRDNGGDALSGQASPASAAATRQ